MSFDDASRQAQSVREQAEVYRQAQQNREDEARRVLQEWRQSLKDFGQWFATEAAKKAVATLPIVSSTERRVRVEPPKKLFAKRPKFPTYETVTDEERTFGWGLLPLHPGTGTVHYGNAGNPRKYDGTWHYDDYMYYKIAHLGLAVDVEGRVTVGELRHNEIRISVPKTDRDHLFIGLTPDNLTPEQLMHNVAHMAIPEVMFRPSTPMWATAPTVFTAEESNRMLKRYLDTNAALTHGILSYYVAYAQTLLEGTASRSH